MLPLRDHNPSRTVPFITYLLIGINVLVFIYMLMLPEPALQSFVNSYAVVPARITAGTGMIALVTSMFLHGSIGHIIGNMLFLHIFGDNLEDRLGHITYLIFYVICGLAASFLQIVTDPASSIPNLGASGAIAGLLGGYLVLFPRQPIDVLISYGLFLRRSTVPAFFMLFFWFIAQLFSGFGSLSVPQSGGVAYFAHIGGFVAGALIVLLFRSRLQRTGIMNG